MPRATQAVALVPHPATPCEAVQSIWVHVHREPRALRVRYVLVGDLERLWIPPRSRTPMRADGLWRHTCFEAFVAAAGTPAYHEFNLSPSGEWAAYAFSGYREGATPIDGAPQIECLASPGQLALQAKLPCIAEGTLRVGLSAVIEEHGGGLTYWALRHAGGKPDFHHAASFGLELDEVRR